MRYNRPRSICGSHSLTKTKLQDRAHLSWERHDSDLETGSILCIAGTVRKNIAKKNTGKIKIPVLYHNELYVRERNTLGWESSGSSVFFMLLCVVRCTPRGAGKPLCCVYTSQQGKDTLLQNLSQCFIFYLFYSPAHFPFLGKIPHCLLISML